METTQDQFSGESAQDFFATLQKVAKDYHDDPQFRAQLDEAPRATLAARGLTLPATGDVRVVANTKDVFHVVLPPALNVEMTDEALTKTAGGVGSLFCFGSRRHW